MARRLLSILLCGLAALCAAGCASIKPAPYATELDFAQIQPGWTRDQVVARFGPPTRTFQVWQENLTIMNYRYNRSSCTIHQISVRPDGTVRDAGPAWDTACDGPSRA
jgi:hypothetical protein